MENFIDHTCEEKLIEKLVFGSARLSSFVTWTATSFSGSRNKARKCWKKHRKGLFLGVVLKCKIAGGPSVSVGMWPILG
jgi:hypothetical protein